MCYAPVIVIFFKGSQKLPIHSPAIISLRFEWLSERLATRNVVWKVLNSFQLWLWLLHAPPPLLMLTQFASSLSKWNLLYRGFHFFSLLSIFTKLHTEKNHRPHPSLRQEGRKAEPNPRATWQQWAESMKRTNYWKLRIDSMLFVCFPSRFSSLEKKGTSRYPISFMNYWKFHFKNNNKLFWLESDSFPIHFNFLLTSSSFIYLRNFILHPFPFFPLSSLQSITNCVLNLIRFDSHHLHFNQKQTKHNTRNFFVELSHDTAKRISFLSHSIRD